MMSPALRLALVVGGAAAYLGLAVLGWGGLAAFFSHPALIAIAIAFFALSGVALFAAEMSVQECARIGATAGSSRSSG